MPSYADYHVGLKVLLRRGEEFLVLHSPERESWSAAIWDFPGGRINDTERELPLEGILDREIREELGDDLKYELGEPIFACRRYIAHKDWHVFLVYYEARYLGGEIKLSAEHTDHAWIDSRNQDLKPEDFVSAEEYRAFKKFLSKHVVSV